MIAMDHGPIIVKASKLILVAFSFESQNATYQEDIHGNYICAYKFFIEI